MSRHASHDSLTRGMDDAAWPGDPYIADLEDRISPRTEFSDVPLRLTEAEARALAQWPIGGERPEYSGRWSIKNWEKSEEEERRIRSEEARAERARRHAEAEAEQSEYRALQEARAAEVAERDRQRAEAEAVATTNRIRREVERLRDRQDLDELFLHDSMLARQELLKFVRESASKLAGVRSMPPDVYREFIQGVREARAAVREDIARRRSAGTLTPIEMKCEAYRICWYCGHFIPIVCDSQLLPFCSNVCTGRYGVR